MPTKTSEARSTEVRARAEASFRKEERAREGAQAMQEYQANTRALREKTERLKALRLAKEAADKKAELAPPAKAEPVPSDKIALKRTHPRRKKNQQPH